MKLAIREPVRDYKGDPVEEPMGQGEGGAVLTRTLIWETVVFVALNFQDPQKPQTSEEKLRCYQITQKVYAGPEPDLTVGERAFIIEKVDAVYNPLVCGRAREFFDGKEHKNGAKNAEGA